VTVESDKASMEIPSAAAGRVKELKVKVGDKVSEGSLLLMLEADAAGEPAEDKKAQPAPTPPAPAPTPAPARKPEAPAAPPAAARGGRIDVAVPDIGDFKDVEVIEVLVKVGDTVANEQSLVTVESDKASMEIPSSAAGRVAELKVKIGDKVSQGTPLAVIETSMRPRPEASLRSALHLHCPAAGC
jgi:pyruvate/2-oxoglutarate dehydrogenase complex dihydrolipoamide acyltransferase (E2) component